ncbi:MAG: hypothetical protein V7723_15460 [Sneathiella sp.]|uniref:hypothetical protein n=1 Tax=Sneathiella sp. TaxID=1964365 RepID=UPI0030022E0F
MAEIATPFAEYVIQTLVSESWRSFDRYETEDSAQDIARQLVEDWGGARVRILGGYFCDEKNRNVYHRVEITDAPQTGLFHKFALAKMSSSKKFIGGSAVSGALLVGSLILFAALPPFTSLADDGQKTVSTPAVSDPEEKSIATPKKPAAPVVAAIAPPPKPVDLQAKFLEIANVPYGRVKDFKAAPIRLRGPWSIECWKHPEMLVIREHKLDQSPVKTSVQDTTAFSTVWQSGQRYGIHLEDGSVYILDLVSFDQIKPLGSLSQDGDFTAETKDNVLNRCI